MQRTHFLTAFALLVLFPFLGLARPATEGRKKKAQSPRVENVNEMEMVPRKLAVRKKSCQFCKSAACSDVYTVKCQRACLRCPDFHKGRDWCIHLSEDSEVPMIDDADFQNKCFSGKSIDHNGMTSFASPETGASYACMYVCSDGEWTLLSEA